MALTTVNPALLDTQAQYTGFKNRIINGAMGISQRGSSFSNVGSGSPPTYTLDRWFGFRGAYAANLDVSQQFGFSGYQYCLRAQRTSGTSSTQYIVINQIIESNNIYDLAGQSVTLSFSIRSGANFSGGTASVILYTSTAANQTSSGIAGGSWTGVASPIAQAITPNTTGAQYTFTASIPSNVLSMCVQFGYTPSGTAGANDYIDITGVQLEKGSTATSFDYRPYGTELALCQRYYWQLSAATITSGELDFALFTQQGTNLAYFILQNPVQMRAAPTVTYSGTITWTQNGAQTTATISGVLSNPQTNLGQITNTGALTAGTTGRVFINYGASGVVAVSAEI